MQNYLVRVRSFGCRSDSAGHEVWLFADAPEFATFHLEINLTENFPLRSYPNFFPNRELYSLMNISRTPVLFLGDRFIRVKISEETRLETSYLILETTPICVVEFLFEHQIDLKA